MKLFVSLYQKWIDGQTTTAKGFNQEDKKIADKLLARQGANYKRLIKGIEIL